MMNAFSFILNPLRPRKSLSRVRPVVFILEVAVLKEIYALSDILDHLRKEKIMSPSKPVVSSSGVAVLKGIDVLSGILDQLRVKLWNEFNARTERKAEEILIE